MKKTNLIPRLRSGLTLSKAEELKSARKLFLIIFGIGFAFISLAGAEELTQQAKITPPVQEFKDGTSPVRNTELEGLNKISNGTRIIVTTSGPAKFSSRWLDNPPRLIVEFQTKNIVSKIENELVVNEGVIKRIISEYYDDTQKSLKSLTFELLEKAPYKIWQEDNNIILDIQASLAVPLSNEGKEVFVKEEFKEQIVKRLETMEVAFKQTQESQPSAMVLGGIQETSRTVKHVASTKAETGLFTDATVSGFVLAEPIKVRKKWLGIIFWFVGLVFISGLGFLFYWLFWRRCRLILDKNLAVQEIFMLKMQLQEQNKLFEQEQIIRKTVESTSLQKEKEFGQLKTEFQKEQQLLEQEQKARKTAEEGLSQKEKEVVEIKGSLESLKEVLVEKGIAKKLAAITEKEGELWIVDKSPDKREFPRLDLSKDYTRTIILRIDGSTSLTINPERSRRIESVDKSKSIKSFANNIGLEGLCFETRRDFEEKEKINLRLFFFGDKVPILKIKADIIWKKTVLPVNYYGVSFVSIEEKDKASLSQYIELKRTKG